MTCGIQHGSLNVLCSAKYGHKGPCVGSSRVVPWPIWYNWPGCKHQSEHGLMTPSWCNKCGVAIVSFNRAGPVPCDGLPF